MSATVNSHFDVPQYAPNGSVSPTALGGFVTLTSGGWVENKGPSALYMVAIGDNDAKSEPTLHGKEILVNKSIELPAGMNLADYGLLADGPQGSALVIGS